VIVLDHSHVNLSRSPIVCAVQTDKPLPISAWRIVGELATAVETAAHELRALDVEVVETDV
jgi:hypothetical protein